MNKLAFFIAVSLWGNIAFPQSTADVEELKIAFVYNFSKYITWPQSAFGTSEDFTFCVAGDSSLLAKFDVLAGQLTNQKTVRVVPMQSPDRATQDCHVLYISAGYKADIKPLLDITDDKPLLTVGDSNGFAEQGGVIELMEVDNKITFRINQAQALAKNLTISSRLLRLAR
ncbi:MAG: YfiR family protein [Pseudomonadota bacterium]